MGFNIKKLKELFNSDNLKRDFLTGLIALGPLILTLYILFTFISLFGNFFANLLLLIPGVESIPPIVKTIIGFLIGLILVFLAGLSARIFIEFQLESFINNLVSKIPLVNTIYNAVRDLLGFFSMSKEKNLQQSRTALFKLNDGGPYFLGFVTREAPLEVDGKKIYTVFMPTTPNPTTGFYFLVEESRLVFVDLDLTDAFKIIMTAGLSLDIKGGESLYNGFAELLKKTDQQN